MRAPYPVTLTQVDDGTIITQVGCKTIVFTSVETLITGLRDYFTDPEKTIRERSQTYGWNLNEPAAGVATAIGYAAGGATVGGRY